jgi:hypothetical protein
MSNATASVISLEEFEVYHIPVSSSAQYARQTPMGIPTSTSSNAHVHLVEIVMVLTTLGQRQHMPLSLIRAVISTLHLKRPPKLLNTTLREALHALDPEGKSLVFNVATSGFDQILEYMVSLESFARRPAMVNTCAKELDGREWSVLQAVQAKLHNVVNDINACRQGDWEIRNDLCEQANRLTRCRHILRSAGAVENPSVTLRWRISG